MSNSGQMFRYSESPTMTYRQWLAGMALHGLLTCPNVHGTLDGLASESVNYADTLIAKLEEKSQ